MNPLQLFTFIRNHINISHLNEPCITSKSRRFRANSLVSNEGITIKRTMPVVYEENDKKRLYLKNNDVIHIVSETCRITDENEDFNLNDDSKDDGSEFTFITNIDADTAIKTIERIKSEK